MASLVPKSRPKINQTDAFAWLKHNNFTGDGIVLLSIRGYYLDQFGKKGQNDRNVYDDAICVMEIRGGKVIMFRTFNFNTDPSKTKKGMAYVKPGIYTYQKQKHRGKYWAFGQKSAVDLDRDGPGGITSGYFGINIHKGGTNDTWSLGCQTVPMTQWTEFVNLIYETMKSRKIDSITYVLTDELARRIWKASLVVPSVTSTPVVVTEDITEFVLPPIQDVEEVKDPTRIIDLALTAEVPIQPVLVEDTVIKPSRIPMREIKLKEVIVEATRDKDNWIVSFIHNVFNQKK